MERESGQLSVDSSPCYQHQFFPGGGGKQSLHPSGRSLSGDQPDIAANWSRNVPQNGERPSHGEDWRSKSWDWDSVSFTAQRANRAAEGSGGEVSRRHSNHENGNHRKDADLGLKLDTRGSGTPESGHQVIQIDDDETEPQSQPFFGRETPSPPLNESNPYTRGDDSPEDDGPLSLNLGGNLYGYFEENGSRNGKRGRSSSPQSQLPTCQVDGCNADLGKAKDYHRRHKVCELHSKAGKALVSRVMQRFCQQCSRFHPLEQFDEGKRSCRRRLAGHNKRRRKTQPDAGGIRAYHAEDQAGGKSSEILTLLSVLSHLQGPLERASGAATEQDILLQCLRQAGSVPSNSLEDVQRAAPSWSQLTRSADAVLPRVDPSLFASHSNGHNPGLNPSHEAYSLLLQNNLKQAAARIAQENLVSRGVAGNMSYGMSSAEALPRQAGSSQRYDERTASAPGSSQSPPLRLSGDIDPAQLLASVAMTMQQSIAAQGSSQGNRALANGHTVSQPGVQRVLPPHSTIEMRDFGNERLDRNREQDLSFTPHRDRQGQLVPTAPTNSHSRLFSESQSSLRRPSIDLQQPPSQQLSDSSPSGSGSGQQSPGTPDAEWERRNSRISFKLFDKHPGQFPEALRSQIYEWLSHRPSDMESFIRPGCIILTVYLCMPESVWVELITDLPGNVKRLLSTCSDEFWCTGRMLVQVERQSVFIVDGEVIGCRTSDPFSSPYIQSVRPLAIVAGQQTNVVVNGFNFAKSGTRLLCAFQGKYISEEVCEGYLTDVESVASGGDSDLEEDIGGDSVLSAGLFKTEADGGLVGGEVSSTYEEDGDDHSTVTSVSASHGFEDQPLARTDCIAGNEVSGCQADPCDEISPLHHLLVDECTSTLRSRAVVQLDGSIFMSGKLASNFGRCFIEVDQDTLEGNWKPVIVADGPVCAEICTLEDEIEAAAAMAGRVAERQGFERSIVLLWTELARLVEEEDVTRFLNELGWFFQKSYFRHQRGPPQALSVPSMQLKQLLVYSVERNWCAVVTKVLDIAFESEDFDAAFSEVSNVLQEEVSLLHRAVRKKFRPMVELLLAYAPSFLAGISDVETRSFKRKLEFRLKWNTIFKPDMHGPAGLTPLHIAASLRDGEDVVDALTSDPCQVGLHAWLHKQDVSGVTPLNCALEGGNMKSVQLVRAKLARLEDSAINIAPDAFWDQHLSGESIVQLELPVWRTSSTGEMPEPPQTCRDQDFSKLPRHVGGVKGALYKPFLVSIMAVATVCVCVCLLFKSTPDVDDVNSPFLWAGLGIGYE